jgi:hypothetical protein
VTVDQHIQLWNAIGTWVAGAATLAAVIVSLHLARKGERIRVRANLGLRLVFSGDGTPAEEHVALTVVNLSDRPVTVNSIGWRVGKGKNSRSCIQPVYGQYTAQYPKQLAHGEQATFMVSFLTLPSWPKEFATGFVCDLSSGHLRTLRALVHTSVGETVEVIPEADLLQRLRESRGSP